MSLGSDHLGSQIPGGASGGVSSWMTVYDVDFTLLGAQDLKAGGDGVYVIDGKSWTVANMANASSFGVGGGSGLGGVSTAGGWSASAPTHTCPLVHIPMTSLLPNLTMEQGIRVSVYNSTNGKNLVGNSYDGYITSIGSSIADTTLEHMGFYNFGSGYQTWGTMFGAGGFGETIKDNTGDDALFTEIPCIGGRILRTFSCAYAAPWPAENTWRTRTEVMMTAGSDAYLSPKLRLPGDVYLFLAGQIGAAAAPLAWRVSRLRVEARL